MMKTPCHRYKGEFLGMYFDKGKALINEPLDDLATPNSSLLKYRRSALMILSKVKKG